MKTKLKNACLVFGFCLFFCLSISFSHFLGAQEAEEEALVRAQFMGYEDNDVIFRIINELNTPIIIKGLSYRRQILYRPLEKDAVVSAFSKEKSFRDVLFRTTGDFIWSENHMDQFRLAYQLPDSSKRMYVKLIPAFEETNDKKQQTQEIDAREDVQADNQSDSERPKD